MSNLTGTGLVLQVNGKGDLPVAPGATTFQFGFAFVEGSSYEVTVRTQPVDPAQVCTVGNARGMVGSGDVVDVKVDCVTAHGIAGKVQGLEGAGLRLHLGWDGGPGEDLPVSPAAPAADVPFAFQSRVLTGAAYSVTVAASPTSPAQVCSVENPEGEISHADVSNITVTCSTHAFTVGGTVKDLAPGSEVVLQNGTDLLTVASSGDFRFVAPVADRATYTVKVKTQPTNPWQTCEVENDTGTVSGADVSTVSVTCTRIRYAVSGSIGGLTRSGLVLSLDGETLPIPAGSTGFRFTGRVASGDEYHVLVQAQPVNLTCRVDSGGDGRMGGADVANVSVVCVCSGVAGVAASAYQCVDFDGDMPAWTQAVGGSGSLSRTSGMARSPSYSLAGAVALHGDGVGTITWNDAGAQTIQDISVSAAIAPVVPAPVVPVSPDGVSLVCIGAGTNTTCLKYTVNGQVFGSVPAFTGIYVEWRYVGDGARSDICRPSVPDLTLNAWNTVTLTANPSTGAIDLVVNGVSALAGCTASRTSASTVAAVTVGPSTGVACQGSCPGWTGYFDDIVAIVRR